MGHTAREKKPRALGGGRSARYESRRAARKAERAYAPAWSDAAATVVLDELHAASAMGVGDDGRRRLVPTRGPRIEQSGRRLLCDASQR